MLTLPSPPLPALSKNLTQEQAAAVAAITDTNENLLLNAVAGSGKSFTLLAQMAQVNHSFPTATIAGIAFNNRIVDELQEKVRKRGILRATILTAHKFGKLACESKLQRVNIVKWKLNELAKPLLKKLGGNFFLEDALCKLVSLGKDAGIGIVERNNAEVWKRLIDHHEVEWDTKVVGLAGFCALAVELLELSANQLNKLDIADLIWMPLFYNWPFKQFDFVFLDEGQDTNATRREVVRRMLRYTLGPDEEGNPEMQQKGRLIAALDPHQAIYGFSGADAHATEALRKEFSAKELPLSTTFRCAKNIVAHAQGFVPHLRAAENADLGGVMEMPEAQFLELIKTEDHSTSAVLCRKNAPLIKLACELLLLRIPCRIEGADIGRQLCTLARKQEARNAFDLHTKLSVFLGQQSTKLSSWKFEKLNDNVQCLLALCRLSPNAAVSTILTQIDELFSDFDPKTPVKLTLSSVHKAKGLEWKTVFLLGRNLWMPHPSATLEWMKEQEDNLIYVAITRAMKLLVEVKVEEA